MIQWTRMNFRHNGWKAGYRYFAAWSARSGYWGPGQRRLKEWLTAEYGPHRLYLAGPPTREDLSRCYWTGWHLPFQLNPHWNIDTEKRRLYISESALMWARLKGKCD